MENYKLFKELTKPLIRQVKLPKYEITNGSPITTYEIKEIPFKLGKYDVELSRTDTTITYKRYSSKTYEQVAEDLIRLKYTVSGELAIHRQKEVKQDEYQEYFNYCEECKAYAKQLIAERKDAIGI